MQTSDFLYRLKLSFVSVKHQIVYFERKSKLNRARASKRN